MKDSSERDPLLMTDDISIGSDYDSVESDAAMTLRIRAFVDAEIDVRPSTTVAECKAATIKALGKEAEGRYLRLIVKGRLLAPDTKTIGDFGLVDGDVVHAVLAPKGQKPGAQAHLQTGQLNRRALRGVGVGVDGLAVRSTDREEEDSDPSDVETGEERLGFDRLRATGLRRSQITALRTYFSPQVDRWIRQHPDQVAAIAETDAMRRRWREEDLWMQAQGPASEFRLNLAGTVMNNGLLLSRSELRSGMSTTVGTDRDFLWGFLLGFFVGFLMLVWVWMPTVPHKQKLGILTGISFQLALSMLGGVEDTKDLLD